MKKEPALIIGALVSALVAAYQAWAGEPPSQVVQDVLPILIGAVCIRFGVVSPASMAKGLELARKQERKHADKRVSAAVTAERTYAINPKSRRS